MKSLVTGITGQSCSYLAELLLQKGHTVYGVVRRSSSPNYWRIEHLLSRERFHLVQGDVTDPHSVGEFLDEVCPDYIFNGAAQSFVKASFSQPSYTFQADTMGVLYILEWMRKNQGRDYMPRLTQFSTSEMYGSSYSCDDVDACYQDEDTPFVPNSPYAIAKLAAHHLVNLYRRSYGVWAATGIIFNMESPRRGEEFVTRKITKWLGRFIEWLGWHSFESLKFDDDYIYLPSRTEKFPKLRLGNIEAKRDWTHAKDTMRGVYLISQRDTPDDFVLASGQARTVKEFLQVAFSMVKIPPALHAKLYTIDPKFYRPCEVPFLCGDATKANAALGWSPEISFNELVQEMVEGDLCVSAWLD